MSEAGEDDVLMYASGVGGDRLYIYEKGAEAYYKVTVSADNGELSMRFDSDGLKRFAAELHEKLGEP